MKSEKKTWEVPMSDLCHVKFDLVQSPCLTKWGETIHPQKQARKCVELLITPQCSVQFFFKFGRLVQEGSLGVSNCVNPLLAKSRMADDGCVTGLHRSRSD